MKLIDDWKQAWRWISVNCMAAAGIVQTAWLSIPDDMRMNVPPNLISTLTLVLLAAGIVGRVVKQDV